MTRWYWSGITRQYSTVQYSTHSALSVMIYLWTKTARSIFAATSHTRLDAYPVFLYRQRRQGPQVALDRSTPTIAVKGRIGEEVELTKHKPVDLQMPSNQIESYSTVVNRGMPGRTVYMALGAKAKKCKNWGMIVTCPGEKCSWKQCQRSNHITETSKIWIPPSKKSRMKVTGPTIISREKADVIMNLQPTSRVPANNMAKTLWGYYR